MNKLKQQLVNNKLMQNNEQISLYEKAIDEIFDKDNPACIDILMQGFHDETDEYAVMSSNLHAIEFFSKSIGLKKYIEIILPQLKNMQPDADKWSETFFFRLINSDNAFEYVLNYISKIKDIEDKRTITKITNNLINSNPQKFKEKGLEILNIINKM